MPQINPDYLKEYSQGCKIFIETGTYLGTGVEIVRNTNMFDEIHSIEIEEHLYNMAVQRFKDDPRVKIWHGDSPDVLREKILPNIKDRVTFWLDSHCMGSAPFVPSGTIGSNKYGKCPLLFEVDVIKEFGIKDHIIFMDDQRLFDTHYWDFVKREDYLRKVSEINSEYKFKWLDGGFSDGQQHEPDDIIVAYLE